MYRRISSLVFAISFALLIILLSAGYSYADQFTNVKYNTAIRTNKLNYVHVVKMGSKLKGMKKITVSSSNPKVVFTNSEAANYLGEPFFTPQKKGKAVLTIKIKKSGKTDTYKIRIGVKTAPPKTTKVVKKYKVVYKLNGGKNNKNNKKTFLATTKTFKLNAAKKSGYDFGGWYTNKNLTKKITKIKKGTKKNVTVYARWIKRIKFSSTAKVSASQANMVFNALKSGKISAEKINKTWYYKFTKGNNAILFPASTFLNTKSTNVPAWFNNGASSKLNYDRTTYGKDFLTNKFSYLYRTVGKKTYKYKTHTFYKIHGLVQKNEQSIELQTSGGAGVRFIIKNYKTRKTASDYVKLLSSRGTVSSLKIKPEMTVIMNDPGYLNGDMFFDTYSVQAKGIKLSDDLADSIKVVTSFGKMIESFTKLKFSTIANVYGFIDALVEESGIYTGSGRIEQLSDYDVDNEDESIYSYGFQIDSPVYLKESSDFLRFHVDTSLKGNFNGTNTKVTFTMKYV